MQSIIFGIYIEMFNSRYWK